MSDPVALQAVEVIQQMRAEIERLRDMQTFDRQELARLVAEGERLRAALETIAAGDIVICKPLQKLARAALEGKKD